MESQGRQKALIRRISSQASLYHALFACLVVYILIQIIAAIGFLPGNKVLTLFTHTKPVSTPYIAFLASLLTPLAKDMNRPCLWKLYRDRRVMSRIEDLLEDSRRYVELREFIMENFDGCIRKNTTGDGIKYLGNNTLILSTKTPQKPCFVQPKDLRFGPKIMINGTPPTLEEIGFEYPELKLGGHYSGPKYCKRPRHSTAIIIPYRNRDIHLR